MVFVSTAARLVATLGPHNADRQIRALRGDYANPRGSGAVGLLGAIGGTGPPASTNSN